MPGLLGITGMKKEGSLRKAETTRQIQNNIVTAMIKACTKG